MWETLANILAWVTVLSVAGAIISAARGSGKGKARLGLAILSCMLMFFFDGLTPDDEPAKAAVPSGIQAGAGSGRTPSSGAGRGGQTGGEFQP